jgi:hypothetical protein
MQEQIQFLLDKLAKEASSNLEEILQSCRGLCRSDDEFASRMWSETFMNNPGVTQYLFDGIPVFYTEMKFNDNSISFNFHQGSFPKKKRAIDG